MAVCYSDLGDWWTPFYLLTFVHQKVLVGFELVILADVAERCLTCYVVHRDEVMAQRQNALCGRLHMRSQL